MGTGTLTTPITAAKLQSRIDVLPRIQVAYKDTPLERCPRFAAALGTAATVYIKRDDMTGIALGGNKLRNLEFRLAEAVERQADTLILGVDILSNSARQTAGIAAKLGMQLILVLTGEEPSGAYQGNLLIDYILGAEIHFVANHDAQQEKMHELEAEARAAGRKPCIMTASPLFAQASAIAYAECTLEIVRQLAAQGRTLDWLYMTSSGKGIAGPLLAVNALGLPTRVVSVSPSNTQGRAVGIALQVAHEAAQLLGLEVTVSAADLLHHDAYAGEGYGIPTAAGVAAMRLLGTTEGLVADPVYTGKCLAGLIDDLRSGRIRAGETVVFVHTGGQPLLFNRAAEVMALLKTS
jgi:D-cysteine desulfhydrase/L-cysteate sulfo-lyase